jgi:hypothetical protein
VIRKRALAVLMTVLVLGLGLGGGSAGAAEGIVLRTSVTPEEAWVGQRVRLYVEALAVDGWAQITAAGELEIPGTYVLRTESQGTRLSETIGGAAYTGQRYELSLYCQRPGRVEVPPLPVTVNVKQWGANATEVRHEVMTPGAFLACKVPPGAEGIRGLISTTGLTAAQTWSSEPETVAPGDAITRTVTLSAVDVSGMVFPPMRHPGLEGLSIYPGEPSVSDKTDRGSLRGERVEKVTYVCERPGEVVLPGIVLPWWDIDAETLRRIELPGLTFQVAGELAPETTAEPPAAPVAGSRDRLLIVAAIVVLVALGIGTARSLGGRYREWQRARRDSETAYFRRVTAALRAGDPGAISGAIMRWLDRLETGTRPARLDLFLRDHGDDETRAAAATLARCLAEGETFTEARSLGRGLKIARRHLRQSRRNEQREAGVLPELNGRPAAPAPLNPDNWGG